MSTGLIETEQGPRLALSRRVGLIVSKLGVWLALIVLILIAASLSEAFLTPTNLLNIVRQASVVGISAVGVTLVLVTGGVDLSVGAVISLAAVLGATMMAGSDANVPLAVLLVFLVGAVVGAINGVFVARLNLPPFILTLGMGVLVVGVTQLYTGGTAAGSTAPGFRAVLNGTVEIVPVPAIAFGLVALAGLWIQNSTRFGRYLYLIGANRRAARLAGVPIQRSLIGVYVLSGVTAAAAGLVLLARSGVSSTTPGVGLEFDVVSAVILGGTTFEGGRGGIGGTLAGILLLMTAFNLVNILGLNFNVQLIVKGAVLIGAAALYNISRARAD